MEIKNTNENIDNLINCCLCPRNCGINRIEAKGYCGKNSMIEVARAALHMWEEPCISGSRGSGAVFFCGCSLKCVFCQNASISGGKKGIAVTAGRLSEIFLELQEQGANNINLVTADHYIPQVREALMAAKQNGLLIPVIFNCGGYEKVDSLKLLEGLVDVYLPDMKYYSSEISKQYSNAPDYFDVAKAAVSEMFRQVGKPVFSGKNDIIEENMIKKGVIVRHLVLPGAKKDAKSVIKYLYKTYKDDIFISIMNQYTPMHGIEKDFPELGRRLSKREYDDVVDFALGLGVENGFVQEGETARESFIPEFSGEGVRRKANAKHF